MKKMEERRKNKKFKKKENKKYPYKQKPKVVISEETKTKLDKLGTKGDTYDDVIGGLLAGFIEVPIQEISVQTKQGNKKMSKREIIK